MSTADVTENRGAAVVHSTGARARRSVPEGLDAPRAKGGSRYRRFVTAARVDVKRRVLDTKALAFGSGSEDSTDHEFGELAENTAATPLEAHA